VKRRSRRLGSFPSFLDDLARAIRSPQSEKTDDPARPWMMRAALSQGANPRRPQGTPTCYRRASRSVGGVDRSASRQDELTRPRYRPQRHHGPVLDPDAERSHGGLRAGPLVAGKCRLKSIRERRLLELRVNDHREHGDREVRATPEAHGNRVCAEVSSGDGGDQPKIVRIELVDIQHH
jgi:hypothetical protein